MYEFFKKNLILLEFTQIWFNICFYMTLFYTPREKNL